MKAHSFRVFVMLETFPGVFNVPVAARTDAGARRVCAALLRRAYGRKASFFFIAVEPHRGTERL